MSVYIKNMDLPVSCLNCPLETDYGTCGHFTNKDYTKYQSNYNKRPEWCPLIEVPPHGDLINLDELLAKYPSILDDYISLTGRSKVPIVIEANKIKETEYYISPCHCHAKRQPYWQRFRSIYRLKCPSCQLTIEANSKEEAIRGWNDIQEEFSSNGNIRRLLN